MLDEAIEEFGRRAGLDGLGFNADGVAALDLEDLGRLHLERATPAGGGDDEVLMYLALELPPHDTDAPRRILELCHWRHGHPLPLTGGLYADQAMLLTRLPERLTTARTLEEALRFLVDLAPHAVGGNQRA